MSSTPIKKVAVVGGSGWVGAYIVKQLVADGFHVTALTRESSSSTFPAAVTVKNVNYDSPESIREALVGNEAVVSSVATTAIAQQTKIVDAALAEGVKRFIPSEFGINTRNLGDAPIAKILAGKIKVADYLIEKAKQNPDFTWTGVSTGLFFDLTLGKPPSALDLKTKTATIYDSGNEPYQASNANFIAKAVSSILKHPQETANKYLSIASFQPSRNGIVKILEEETGSKWNIKHESTAELQKTGEEKLSRGDYSAFSELLRAYSFRDGEGHALRAGESANELLGLPAKEDLRETIKKWLASEGV